ncbi:MAG: YciI family protein [Bacteroidota bacterium]|nr:YciI family protein [Bacteroidota bacterium]
MEKFMLIFHGGIKQDASPEDLQTNMGQWMAWVEKLNQEGKYVSGEPLLPGGKLVSSNTTVTDGPYTEGKEVVGGYFIINATNMDEAVAECQHYPDFSYGGQVQVRQVMQLDM